MAQKKFEIKQTNLFIGGKFVQAKSGKKFKTINPSTEEVLAEVWEAGNDDVDLAVDAARKAFDEGPWRKMSAQDRGNLMYKLADLIDKNAEELATLDSLDNGKPYAFAFGFDIAQCRDVIRYFAGWCDKITGQTIPMTGPHFCYTRVEPTGVCGQIIPWNFPLLMGIWKMAPALACGCTIVLKPAEQTPLSALRLGELFNEAGFPPGVVNIITGYGQTGAYLVNHPRVDKIAFTGSSEVGQEIMQKCSINNLKRISLELGGKSPLIVMDDCDLDTAVQTARFGLFFNQGQVCCASSRIFVHEKIYDEFVKKSVEAAKTIKVGDPFDKDTFQGPQVDETQFKKVMYYLEQGQKQGAKMHCGGKRVGNKGYFIEPTVFSDVTDDMLIAKDEIFGPSMQLLKFSTIDEVIKRANNTVYGLASAVMTNSIETYLKIANALKAGTVYVNCYDVFSPVTAFGGYKLSGFGKDLGELALKNYLEYKTIIVKQTEDTDRY